MVHMLLGSITAHSRLVCEERLSWASFRKIQQQNSDVSIPGSWEAGICNTALSCCSTAFFF